MRKFLILFTLILSFQPGMFAQGSITVTGTITEADTSVPIPGVNILEKGTDNGVMTDFDGNYSIEVPENATLVVSFVGFTAQTLEVNGRSEIDIVMKEEAAALDEVVVVGYGTKKKVNLTGSVASVNMDELEAIPAGNSASVLQGRLPGVTVSNFSAQPGNDNPQIRIRGIGSFNAGQEPLVIVDGVQSQLNQIPLTDIASVSVLKDAASAAIYGVRAANGVILVTTKRGKSGKPTINIRSNVAFQEPVVEPDFLDSYDWAMIRNEWAMAEGGNPVYTDEQIQTIRNGSDPDRFANTDWWDAVTQTGILQTHSASVNGGTENIRYMISGEFLDQEGIVVGTDTDRKSLRSNLDVDVSEKLKIGLNIYGFSRETGEPSLRSVGNPGNFENNLLYSLRRFTQPTVPIRYSSGEYGFVDGLYPDGGMIIRNPLWEATTGDSRTEQFRVEGKLFASYELLEGLTFTSSLANIHSSSINTRFVPTYQQFSGEGEVVNQNINNSLSNNNTTFKRFVFENLLNYDLSLGKHDFTVLLGHTAQEERNDYMYGYIQNFPNNELRELGAGVSNPQVDGNAYEVALQSFFGRLNYTLDKKYLFEMNLRYDGSSRMPQESRYGLFPSFSAGWIISNEDFLKDSSTISLLKLRGSWGQLGNQEIGNYAYVQNIATGADYILGGSIAGGVAVNNLANPNITWETTTISDVGIDVNFFDSRLQITADYFQKNSSDILIRLPIPNTLGVNNGPYQNAAEVSNKGWEADVSYRNNVGDLDYFAGFNFSTVKNVIEDIAGLENWISGNTINRVGHPIGAYYGYVADGYFDSEEEIENAASQWGTLRPGDIRYKDISGPEGIPDGQITAEYDRQIIGNPYPKYNYGFYLGGAFKGFDLNLFFQGVSGIERFFWYNTENIGQFTNSILDNWSETNRDAAYPRFGNSANNYNMSTFWLRDASYLRLKTMELGYNIPQSFTQQLAIPKVRLYFVGNNLYTFTDVEEFDPEVESSDVRSASYPGVKAYSFGINITF
ncbi:SusC/RagA family TonB-linked outer membrane protein [Zunongwangia sp. H14]|uniref:SusC/RagA family TonB-linked outer membrane protein n=1 Tax=Zunongwangia sp. H14 TaxID=3240792 RepID=UPI003569050B